MDLESITEEGARARALAAFHEHRGWFLAAGVALVGLGVLAVAVPFVFTIAFDYVIGALLLASAVVHGIHAVQVRHWSGALPRLLVAALYAIAALVILFSPVTGALALTLTLSAFLLAAGVSRLVLARHLHPHPGWGWTMVSGLLSIALGTILFVGWPSTAAWAIGLYVGIDLLFAGWSLLGLALAAPAVVAR